MTLKAFVTPAILVAGLLFAMATLQQAMGLFVQTFSSAGTVAIAPEPTPTAMPVGVLIPLDASASAGIVPEATAPPETSPPTVTATATATATPVAGVDATTTATSTPTQPPATGTPSPSPTVTKTPTRTPAPSPSATPTATTTLEPLPTRTATPVACPAEGLKLSLEATTAATRRLAAGTPATLRNDGAAPLPAETLLVAPDVIRVIDVTRDRELAYDPEAQAWLLPELPAGQSLDLLLVTEPLRGTDASAKAQAVSIDQVVMLEVLARCAGRQVPVLREKLVVGAIEATPVPVKPVQVTEAAGAGSPLDVASR